MKRNRATRSTPASLAFCLAGLLCLILSSSSSAHLGPAWAPTTPVDPIDAFENMTVIDQSQYVGGATYRVSNTQTIGQSIRVDLAGRLVGVDLVAFPCDCTGSLELVVTDGSGTPHGPVSLPLSQVRGGYELEYGARRTLVDLSALDLIVDKDEMIHLRFNSRGGVCNVSQHFCTAGRFNGICSQNSDCDPFFDLRASTTDTYSGGQLSRNGVPQPADLMFKTYLTPLFGGDCDANGRFDDGDLAAGSPDCNANARPDTCDVRATHGGTALAPGGLHDGFGAYTATRPGDFDGDGDFDLIVLAPNGKPILFLNDGTGAFHASEPLMLQRIAVDPSTSRLWVTEGRFYDTAGSVVSLEPATQTMTRLPASILHPSGIAVSPAGDRLYVTQDEEGKLLEVTVADGAIRTIADGLLRPGDVALLPGQAAVLVLQVNQITRVDVVTGAKSAIAPMSSYVDLDVNSTGTTAYVSDGYHIKAIDVATGALSSIQQFPRGPGLALLPGNAEALTGSPQNELWAVSLNFNSGRLVAANLPFEPKDIDVDPTGTFAYVVNENHGVISVRLSDGLWSRVSAAPAVETGEFSFPAATGDFDRDGRLDFVLFEGAAIALYRNAGNGPDGVPRFAGPVFYPTGGDAYDGRTADLDDDGDLDLVVAGADLRVLFNTGNGTFGPALHYGDATSLWGGVAVDDYDGDGAPDLAVARYEWQGGGISIRLNDGLGGFSTVSPEEPAGPGVVGVVSGDLNGDGRPDLVVTDEFDQVWVLKNQGVNAAGIPLWTGNGWSVAHDPFNSELVDLDMDGDLDILTAHNNAAKVTVLLNRSDASFTLSALPGQALAGVITSVSDLDANGAPDVIASIWSSERFGSGSFLRVWMNMTGPFADCDGNSTPDACQPDGDGDGHIDACDGCPADPTLPIPETCNGADDDCDGTADDGNPGGGGACGTSNIGACRLGTVQCTAGALMCVGSVGPSPEVCDGLDNNCDGSVPASEADVDRDGFRICAGDCQDAISTIYPSAPEINDGRDNQCPGNAGYNLIDELASNTGFNNGGAAADFCWSAQTGATTYQAVRSTRPDFASGCETFVTGGACWNDPSVPASGQTFYYLTRSVAPHVGSWGGGAGGAERTVACVQETACADGVDDDLDGLFDCEDPDCVAACVSEFTFVDTLADDLQPDGLMAFFAAARTETYDSHILFEIQGSVTEAWCAANAAFYRDRYLLFAPYGGQWFSGDWPRYARSPASGDQWIGPFTTSHINATCAGRYSWCTERGLFNMFLNVAPEYPGECEAFSSLRGCGTSRLRIRFGPDRLSACGF